MAFPFLMAGMAAASLASSVLGGAMGSGKDAGQIALPQYDIHGVGLANMKRGVAENVRDQVGRSRQLGGMIPGLISEFDRPQGLDQYGSDTMNLAIGTFGEQLRNAKLNALNVAGNQIGGSMSALAQNGVSTMGAGAANIKAGVLAQSQASLNETAAKQAMALMELRGNLVQNVQDRLMSKASFITSQQAQADTQASANLGTLMNDDMAQRNLQFNTDAYNAQLSLASTKKKGGFMGGLAGGLGGLGGAMSMFGGGR